MDGKNKYFNPLKIFPIMFQNNIIYYFEKSKFIHIITSHK